MRAGPANQKYKQGEESTTLQSDPTKEMTKQDFLRMASHIRAGLLSMRPLSKPAVAMATLQRSLTEFYS